MEVANSLAYYDTKTIAAVKGFIVHPPGSIISYEYLAFMNND